jgi:hypothetical protein
MSNNEVNEKNAIALRDESVRHRGLISEQAIRITRLESEIVSLRIELDQVRMMAAAGMGRGSTDGDRG